MGAIMHIARFPVWTKLKDPNTSRAHMQMHARLQLVLELVPNEPQLHFAFDAAKYLHYTYDRGGNSRSMQIAIGRVLPIIIRRTVKQI